MNRIQRLRRVLAVAMVVAGIGLLVAPPVVAQDQVRTQTDLLGYNMRAQAAPLTIRFFENFIPIPTDPGDPQFELTASHTSARLGTGPSGRAVASSVWPGPAVGDGFGTITGDESQSYPIRAAATYPGSGKEDWESSQTIPGVEDFGMRASARGLDVWAAAEGGGVPGPAEALAEFGQIRSESHATVKEGQARSTGKAQIARLSLLEGTIVLTDVSTTVAATSDGKTAATDGRTTIGGITVLGQPVRLTDQGAQVTPPEESQDGEDGDGGSDNPLGDVADAVDPVNTAFQRLTDDLVADGLEETLGITIEALDHEETIDGAVGKRTAGGVRITVDLKVLKGYLDPILSSVPLNEVISSLPQDLADLKGLLFEAQALAPKIEIVVARGVVNASASPAFEVSAPAPPPPPPPATSPNTSLPGTSTSVSSPVTSSPGQAPQAEVAPPATTSTTPEPPALAASEPPPIFQGIPLGLAALTLFLAAVPTWGLTTLRESAVGSGASLEPPRQLPDLRGGA